MGGWWLVMVIIPISGHGCGCGDDCAGFFLSVVDMALVLAPSTPAPLAVAPLDWYQTRPAPAFCRLGSGCPATADLSCRYRCDAADRISGALLGRAVARQGHRNPHLRRGLATLLPVVITLGGVVPLACVLGMAAALSGRWQQSGGFLTACQRPTMRYWMGL